MNTWNSRRASVLSWLGWCCKRGYDGPTVPTWAKRLTEPDSETPARSKMAIDWLIARRIAHTIGVGTSSGWSRLGGSGTWTGARATALVRQYDGASAKISTGGGHFWPYGLNYDNEFSGTAADRHVRIVAAMVSDGL